MVHELNEKNFEAEVLQSDIPVLVDFWAAWCGPCRMVAPVVERLAEDYEGRVKVAKVNVDEEQTLAANYRVASIPMLFVFKNGEVVNQLVGARPYEELAAALDEEI